MFTIPIDKAIEAGVIEVKNSWKKLLTFGWGDGKVFSVDGTGRNTTGNLSTDS